MHPVLFYFLVLVAMLPALLPDAAHAQRASLVWENDVIGRTDSDYTDGFRASVNFDDLSKSLLVRQTFDFFKPGLFTAGAPEGPKRQQIEYSLGQSIYTPDRITAPSRQPGDRPFGGWLNAGVSIAEESNKSQLDTFEFQAGVVGPAALATQTQTAFHRLIGDSSPVINGYEIKNEPGFLLSWDRRWKFSQPLSGTYGFDIIPSVGLTGGNVFTYGSAGLIARFGQNMAYSWGPTRIRPATSGAFFAAENEPATFGFDIFAGFEGRAVVRNIFLDGNTFANSPTVTKNVFVGDLIAGAEIFSSSGFRLAFTAIYRTREYTTQSRDQLFGSAQASVKF